MGRTSLLADRLRPVAAHVTDGDGTARAEAGVDIDSRTMSGNQRRQRELNRQKQERQAERRETNARRKKRRQRIVAAVTAFALVAASIVWAVLAVTGDSDEPIASSTPTPAATSAATSDPAAGEDEHIDDAAEPIDCSEPVPTRANDMAFDAPGTPSELGTVTADLTLTTNCGDIVIQTLPDLAPQTVASQVFLAESGFYDAVSCHRLTTAGIFVLQCGDPAGDGTGGPGYAVPDENLPAEAEANYPAGTVAMANAGPGTAGSQFFIVYKDTTLIPANYTIWGNVVEGLDIVRGIAGAGVEAGSSDGAPAQPVVIEKATVSAAG